MTPRSVIVLGPSYGRYPEAVARGFAQNGLRTHSFTYPDPALSTAELLSWEILPMLGLTSLRRVWLDHTVQHVKEACREAALLVIIKGDRLPLAQYAELLDQIRCPKVLWLMDSIHNVKEGLLRASLADLLLYFEGTDRHSLAALPIPHHHVAMATDPAWYRPVGGVERLWDVSFFGVFHENRLATFEAIVAGLPPEARLKIRFAGPWRTRNHPVRAYRRMARYPLTAQHLKHVRHWTHDQINTFYNQSGICLNVLHPQSVDSMNPRAFETCCSGALLLCQANAALGRHFVLGREVEAFETPEEGAAKVLFYSRNEDSARKIAAAGRDRVLRDHTMLVRTRQILSLMKAEHLL